MDKKQENLLKNSNKIVKRNARGQLEKGSILNPNGRPQGSLDFKTLMNLAVEDIAKVNNLPESEVWKILITKGYSEAKNGNYMFYKDILDRYYGKAQDNINVKGEISISKVLDEINE